MELYKYLRTAHIFGSRLQKGDEDLKIIPTKEIENKFLVIEEKIDGANTGISFDKDGNIFLQSRGHYLTGGYRERHFNLLKMWSGIYKKELFEVLSFKYILYGEWLYAKHTVFYDKLSHYFFEFDIFDKETKVFLSTKEREKLLKPLGFLVSVPILKEGMFKDSAEIIVLLSKSLYKSENWKENLEICCSKNKFDFNSILEQTDNSELAEGLYIKWEEDDIVKGRYKYVRNEFIAQITSSDTHWLDRPILPNQLAKENLMENLI